jgi:hypothetical protein
MCGLVTIQDHLQIDQVYNQIEETDSNNFAAVGHVIGYIDSVGAGKNSNHCSPIMSSVDIFQCCKSVSLYWQIK